MTTQTWVWPLGAFAAGAVIVGGIWGGVALLGNTTTAAPGGTVTDATAPGGLENQAPQNDRPAANQSNITDIGQVARNQMVTVQGTVDRITDEDEFIIRDDTGSITVWTGNAFFTTEQGEVVQVTGFVDDDLFIEIYATEIVKDSGEVITIGGYSATDDN